MKMIKYQFLSCMVNYGTPENPDIKPYFVEKTFQYSDDNLLIAEREAYNGEYEIYDDGVEELSAPTQLDIIEAQVTYTAMMTDTLLEV